MVPKGLLKSKYLYLFVLVTLFISVFFYPSQTFAASSPADLPIIGGIFSTFFSQPKKADIKSADVLVVVTNPDFEEGAPNLLEKFLGRIVSVPGWVSIGNPTISINDQKPFIKNGTSSLKLIGKEGEGTKQQVEVAGKRLLSYGASVYAEKGAVTFSIKDAAGNVVNSIASAKQGSWETLTLTPYSKGDVESQKYTLEFTLHDKENVVFLDDVTVNDIGKTSQACDPFAEREFTGCTFYQECRRDGPSSPSGTCYKLPPNVWKNNLTDAQALAIFQYIRGQEFEEFPGPIEFFLPAVRINRINDVVVGQPYSQMGAICGLAGTAGCPPLSDERVMRTLMSMTIEGLVQGNYPDFSQEDVNLMASRMREIQRSKTARALYEYWLISCDTGGPCLVGKVTERFAGLTGKLFPTWVKEGVSSVLKRGGEQIGAKATELVQIISQSTARNAARVSPMVRQYLGKLYIYSLHKKYPLLQSLERTYTTQQGYAKAYSIWDLMMHYPEFATSWQELVTNHLHPYGIDAADMEIFIASSTEDFYTFYNLTQNITNDFTAGYHVYDPVKNKHIIVMNPGQIVQDGDLAFYQILEHEAIHVGMFKYSGEVTLDVLLGNLPADEKELKRKIMVELIGSSLTSGYEGLIKDFKDTLASKISNDPAFRQSLKQVFRIPNYIPESNYSNYVRVKVITPAFQGLVSDNAHPDSTDYVDFSVKWKSVTGKQFHEWVFDILPKPLPSYFDKIPADIVKKHQQGIAEGKKRVEKAKQLNQNINFYDGLCSDVWRGSCDDDLPQYQQTLLGMLRMMKDPTAGFGLGDEPVISNESFSDLLRLVPMASRFSDGVLTRTEVDEVNNMNYHMEIEEPLTVPAMFYEPNGWFDEDPPTSIVPGQPTSTPVPSANRTIGVDVQNQAGDRGGIQRIGVAVYENGAWQQDYLSTTVSRYQNQLDHLSPTSEYRIEPRAKNGSGQDVTEQYVTQRAYDCQGGEVSADHKACIYRNGQSGLATFLIQPSDQPGVTLTPPSPTERPIGGGPSSTPTQVPPTPTIVRAAGSSCQLVSAPVPPVYVNSGNQEIKIRFYNTGNFTWTRDPNQPATTVKVKQVGADAPYYQSPVYPLRDSVPACNGNLTDNCSEEYRLLITSAGQIGTRNFQYQLHQWNGTQDTPFGAICGTTITYLTQPTAVPPTRMPSPTITATPTRTPTPSLTPTITPWPSATPDVSCKYNAQIQLAVNNTAGDPPTQAVLQTITLEKMVKRAGSDIRNWIWGGVFGGNPLAWTSGPFIRLPMSIGGRIINPGDTIQTNLYLPSTLELVPSRNRIVSCPSGVGTCGSIDATDYGATITEPLTCQPELSTQRLTYQIFIQPVRSKTWTINTQAMCPDGTIPQNYYGSVGVAKRERDGARAVQYQGWDAPKAGRHTSTITSDKAGDTILVGMSEDSRSDTSLLFKGVIEPTGITAIAPYGYHSDIDISLGKFTSWNRDNLPSGTYTIGMRAPEEYCAGHMQGKVGEETDSITPLPVPTPVDTFPQIAGGFGLSSTQYMDTTPLKAGQSVTLALPDTQEDTVEKIAVYYKQEGAAQGFASDPTQGWVVLQTLNCQTDDCTTRVRSLTLPENMPAGTYTIAAAVYDHTRPTSGQHFGTIAPVLIQGTALESSTMPCTEASETATYCTAEGLSSTIVVEGN